MTGTVNHPGRLFERRAPAALLALLGAALSLPAANIGTAVPILGQVADLVYDEQRQLVYLANFSQNRIEVYSVGGQRLLTPINVGAAPASVALSPDRQTLYVANNSSNTVSVVDVSTGTLQDEVPIGSRPDSLAVGADGIVVIIGGGGLMRLNAPSRTVTAVAISPPAAPPPGLPAPGAIPTPAGFRAQLAATSDGRLIFGMSANRLFVYEVSSGTVLRSRTMGGLNAAISVAPDGAKFMVGPFLFDSNTLTVLGRTGQVAVTLTGGSVFSADGSTLFATFSTQTPINPLNPNQPALGGGGGAIRPSGPPTLGVLQVLKSSNLTPLLGLRLPDNIISKIILSSDGQNLFAISTSGLVVVPIGRLNEFPIVTVDRDTVVLSVDICNRNVQSTALRVSNAGRGRLTFGAISNNTSAIVTQATGVAPTNLQITYDPRATRTRGTTQAVVVLTSPEAVNVEPTILVSLNFRDVDQRGGIFPVSGTIADLVLDAGRQRIYLANNTRNQIEVFSIPQQAFLPPIEVGASPRSLALVGPNLLVVANTSAENISVVDLDSLQQVDQITMGPVPLNAALPLFPSSIAASNNAILFSTVPLAAGAAAPGNGNVWQLSLGSRTAFPRLNLGSGQANVVDGRTVLGSPANGSSIVLVSGNGTIRLYDPVTDNFPVTRPAAITGLRGNVAAAPDGSFFVVDQSVFNSSLAFQGTVATAGAAGAANNSMAAAVAGTVTFRVRVGTTADPLQRLERFAGLPQNILMAQSQPVLESVVSNPFAPVQQRAQQVLPRSLVVDAPSGSAYALTTSGLSVMPVSLTQGRGPSFRSDSVVNGASFRAPVAPGAIVSIFGDELGDESAANSLPLPTALSGTCVTANDVAIPLFYVSAKQINAQLPPNLPAGSVTLSVRSRNTGVASAGVAVRVEAQAPGVFTLTDSAGRKVAAVFRADDFSLLTPDNYAKRDEDLVLYTTGLGATTPAVGAGQPAPSATLARTSAPQVCIGSHPYLVTFSGLAPGFVGLYQVNIRVPGDRVQGDRLPVVLTMSGTDCRNAPTQGAPTTSIH